MAVESIFISPGTTCPGFRLKDPYGHLYHSKDICGEKGLVVIFTCNHCPYAKAIWPRSISLANQIKSLGVNTVFINPNIHPDYPEDSPEMMLEKIKEWNISFPYLVDESQEVARKFHAQCTPDIYLYNSDLILKYHGRFDDNWKDESNVTKHDLKFAVDCLISNKEIPKEQFPSMGCSIKWR